LPEDMNIEYAHRLTERQGRGRARWEEVIEIVEAIALGLVALATAWAGYQAARWDGRESFLYGSADTIRIEADEKLTLGGQQRLMDVSTFNTWIQAESAGQTELADLYVRRFSPEFRLAFEAWLALDPFEHSGAPPGPSFMAEYENPLLEEGTALHERARVVFDEGTEARDISERYVQITVLLATVLFMIALGQRFRLRNVRIGVLVVAGLLFAYDLVALVRLPRL
jgi:hypothetical protein